MADGISRICASTKHQREEYLIMEEESTLSMQQENNLRTSPDNRSSPVEKPKSRSLKRGIKSRSQEETISSIIKNACDLLQKGIGTESDDIILPQLIWLLFLKFLDDLEYSREEESGEAYEPIISTSYRWREWAAVENKTLQLTGDELLVFINDELFPYLGRLSGSHESDIRTIIGTVFQNTHNLVPSGYTLREVVDKLNAINFNSSECLRSLLPLYEAMLKQIRDAAGKKGNFYTPRPIVRFMVRQLQPRLGECVLDPACGTGGFLVETFERLREVVRRPEQHNLLRDSLTGIEKKQMPYLLCAMNMLLHGIESPHIIERNTLSSSLRQIKDSDRVDVIITNPTFDEKEEQGIRNNFPEGMRSAETYLLFLQYVMAMLKRPGGRCGIVMPNGLLFSSDNVSVEIKQRLLANFNLHTIMRLPQGVFLPYANIPTNILFFDACPSDIEGMCTREVWYYELPKRNPNYTKSKPLQDEEFIDCITWWDKREASERAWKVSIEQILANNYNLDIRNPQKQVEEMFVSPDQLLDGILEKERRILMIIEEIKHALGQK